VRAGYKSHPKGKFISFPITINMLASPLSATTPRSKQAKLFKVKAGTIKQLREEQQ
jgi:hypothetical protein